MWNEYNNPRHIRTLNGVVELQLKIRRCQNKSCLRYKKAYRPEQEGSLALPQNEFGLDVIAYIGALRYQEHIWIKVTRKFNIDRGKLRTDGKKSALPPPLVNLKHLIAKGLSATASLSSPVIVAYQWVDKASNILNNKIALDAAGVKQSYQQLLIEMSQQKQKAGTLNTAIDNFIKTTHTFTASDLAQVDIHTWLELRSQLQKHHKARIEQYRFRRDPKAYLANLESRLL